MFLESAERRAQLKSYAFSIGPQGANRPSPANVRADRPSRLPKVAIAPVTQNCARTLPATLATAIDQHYPNLEVPVIDGASTDATVDVIRAHEQHIDRWVRKPVPGPN